MKITIDGEEIGLEHVIEFCYLGSLTSDGAKCDKERMAMGTEAFIRRRVTAC